MSASLCIEAPLLGPFVEANGLEGPVPGGAHLGAAMSWSSSLGSVSMNLVRSNSSTYRHEHIVFDEFPYLTFQSIFEELFSISPRLFDFLDELTPFIIPPDHAPLPTGCFEWLNPALTKLGFAIGRPRAHQRGVTAPIVWVFRKTDPSKLYGDRYVGVDYLEWCEGKSSVRNGGWVNCSGFATNTLRKYLLLQTNTPNYNLLTLKGQEQMARLGEKAVRLKAKRTAAGSPKIISPNEAAILSRFRTYLVKGGPIPIEISLDIQRLSEKGIISLLHSSVRRRSEAAISELVKVRDIKQATLRKILDACITANLNESVAVLLAITARAESPRSFYLSQVLRCAVDTGDIETVNSVLLALPEISSPILESGLREAAELGDTKMVEFLLDGPQTQNLSEEALLLAFDQDIAWGQWNSAKYWLDLGINPFEIKTEESVRFSQMLRPGGLSILEKVFQLSPPSDFNLRLVLEGCIFGGKETDFALDLSRAVAGHHDRMSDLMQKWFISYMIRGNDGYIKAILLAISEGGTFTRALTDLAEREFLRGHEWQTRQSRLIEIIGALQRNGHKEEAATIAKIKRNSKVEDRVALSGLRAPV